MKKKFQEILILASEETMQPNIAPPLFFHFYLTVEVRHANSQSQEDTKILGASCVGQNALQSQKRKMSAVLKTEGSFIIFKA